MANPGLNAQEKDKLQRYRMLAPVSGSHVDFDWLFLFFSSAYRQAAAQVGVSADIPGGDVACLHTLLELCRLKNLRAVLSASGDKEGRRRERDERLLNLSVQYHVHALFVEWGIIKLVQSRLAKLLECPVDDVIAEPVAVCVEIFFLLSESAGGIEDSLSSYYDVFFEHDVSNLVKDILLRFMERASLARLALDTLVYLVANDPERIVRTAHSTVLSSKGEWTLSL